MTTTGKRPWSASKVPSETLRSPSPAVGYSREFRADKILRYHHFESVPGASQRARQAERGLCCDTPCNLAAACFPALGVREAPLVSRFPLSLGLSVRPCFVLPVSTALRLWPRNTVPYQSSRGYYQHATLTLRKCFCFRPNLDQYPTSCWSGLLSHQRGGLNALSQAVRSGARALDLLSEALVLDYVDLKFSRTLPSWNDQNPFRHNINQAFYSYTQAVRKKEEASPEALREHEQAPPDVGRDTGGASPDSVRENRQTPADDERKKGDISQQLLL